MLTKSHKYAPINPSLPQCSPWCGNLEVPFLRNLENPFLHPYLRSHGAKKQSSSIHIHGAKEQGD